MPSQLRYSSTATSSPITKTHSYSSPLSPQKKQKMSLTQTYYLAHTARAKLSREAARADHDLRLLVGHANLLDGLMLDLAEAEREQESWFHQTVKATEPEEPKHIEWASDPLPVVIEDYEEDSSDDESDADEEEEEEISYVRPTPLRRSAAPSTTIITTEMDIDSEDDDEDEEGLALTRTSSHTPPELLHESDSESDDDAMPPSPPHTLDAYSEKQRRVALFAPKSQSASLPIPAAQEDAFYEEGYYLPQRQAIGAY